jgi:hypothetical protein
MERIGTYGALMWKSDGKRRFGTPRRRWENNIKMYLEGKLTELIWL